MPDMNCRPLCFCIGLLASAAACSGPAPIPSTPDLSGVRASFEQDHLGVLDTTKAEEMIAQSPPLAQLDAAFRATTVAADDAGHAGDEAAPQSSSRIRIQGSVHVVMRCPGELGTPLYDENTNGTVSLTVAVADSHIRRDVGGEAVRCKLRGTVLGTDIRVGLDGPINFDLGRDLGLGEGWSGDLLVNLAGKLTINDSSFENLNARFKDNRFQYLQKLADGTAALLEIAGSGVMVTDRTGTLLCADVQSCVRQ